VPSLLPALSGGGRDGRSGPGRAHLASLYVRNELRRRAQLQRGPGRPPVAPDALRGTAVGLARYRLLRGLVTDLLDLVRDLRAPSTLPAS
jgi:hypothetical protein